MPNITRETLNAWNDYLVGKRCPKHPQNTIREGRYGIWCGEKNAIGGWCDGGFPPEGWQPENN